MKTALCSFSNLKSICEAEASLSTGPLANTAILLNVSVEQAKRCTQDKSGFAGLDDRVVVNATPWQHDNWSKITL